MKLFATLEQRIRLYHQSYMRNQLAELYKIKFELDKTSYPEIDEINKEIERIEQKLTASYKKNRL